MLVNDLAVNVKGDLVFHRFARQESLVHSQGRHTAGRGRRASSIPNGVLFSPDQTLLYVSDYAAQLSWAFQIQPDGSLAHKQRYFYVHMPDAATRSSADGMTVDTNGNVYIATALGRAGLRSDWQVPRDHSRPGSRVVVEREVRRRRPG